MPSEADTTLIDRLLEEQRSLSAVERFSRLHDASGRHAAPALEKHYRSLLPATAPGPGQQYAFEVDLDQCSGCKGCVTACHSLNGLEDGESWRKVGLLTNASRNTQHATRFESSAFPVPPSALQHVTTACHHCADPGCLNGCPVLAYDKDPVTGIVRHLDDQCIGCQYCVMKCPYEVPKYSERLGIVRKCDMCSNRLAVGEAPACVQACPNGAIRISLVTTAAVTAEFRISNAEARRKSEVRDANISEANSAETGLRASTLDLPSSFGIRASKFRPWLPDSPDPAITLPATRYTSARASGSALLAADHHAVKPAQAHVPLAFLLVLTQFAVGASAALVFIADRRLAAGAAVTAMLGLALGGLHLGRPLRAWRAFLGWRTSWFSREVIVFGGYAALAGATAAAWLLPVTAAMPVLTSTSAVLTALAGLAGVFCSAMIYVDTRRELWRASQAFPKFAGTTLLLGCAAAMTVLPAGNFRAAAVAGVMLAALAKLAFERRLLDRADEEDAGLFSKSARLLLGGLGLAWRTRVLLGLAGGVVLPVTFLATSAPGWALAALAALVAGELIERHLFFVAGVTRVMPGGVGA